MNKTIEQWRGGLIVSCQAPAESPLAKPEIIAAFAETAEQNGAVGVRIDPPANIRAVKERVRLPVLGIYKIVLPDSDVYITPDFVSADAVAQAGADVLALDATARSRPNGESLETVVQQIRTGLTQPLMADVAIFDEGVRAAESLGFDLVGTTLSGYTAETKHFTEPDFALVENLANRLTVPVICEGRLRSPEEVRRAFDCGAFAVVVGGAITGIDWLVKQFVRVTPKADFRYLKHNAEGVHDY
jgi:N-acylglucosamine-6-phosphate 2-epimerase